MLRLWKQPNESRSGRVLLGVEVLLWSFLKIQKNPKNVPKYFASPQILKKGHYCLYPKWDSQMHFAPKNAPLDTFCVQSDPCVLLSVIKDEKSMIFEYRYSWGYNFL